jgi:hypothetical protein
MQTFSSVRVVAFGGVNQHAHFEDLKGCGGSDYSYWADGGSGDFQIGSCLSFSNAQRAMESFTF